ncbi:Bis(5'-nucleosyl)-tetraphosphatase, symmetrical [Tolypocladium capitatum]|uniref:Bis(5'-nucleosyl)-tetraphosphatase, symmetrical n=1 Tax=Tolypocladium capitatum TaxID=45235 RepID=A0A2K3QNH6_9HYPO|nr:Bis(5'-nucleosyl)-tetraphosphatase, symmetrical [Tolypocladium capitatum]
MRRPEPGIGNSETATAGRKTDAASTSTAAAFAAAPFAAASTSTTTTARRRRPGAMWWHMGLPQFWQRLALAAAVLLLVSSTATCILRTWGVSYHAHDVPNRHKSGSLTVPMAHSMPTYTGLADVLMSYGEFGRPAMDGLTLIASLPAEYVPTENNGRRLVVVGDIHGMDDELARLLKQIRFNRASDHLVAAGDMVSKGPDSRGVVARLMALNASAVRGNHEDRLLLAYAEADSLVGVGAELASPDAEAHRGEAEHLAVARRFSRQQVAWLSKLPVILTVDPLPIYIVHAGLVPGVPLEKQDPWAVMNMRTLRYLRRVENERLRRGDSSPAPAAQDERSTTHVDEARAVVDAGQAGSHRDVAVPIDSHKGEKWSVAWNREQERVQATKRRTVIYGHDAKRGFVEGRHTFGLDSGCVAGGALTAMIIEGTHGGGFKHTVNQVRCNKASRHR